MTLTTLLWPMWMACKPRPPAAATPSPSATVRIAALNDFHGALYEQATPDGRAIGGLPWLVAAVDALRADEPDLILLDGGDQFQGAWPVNASQGMGSVRAMELLGLDAAAVGNHEFDYGGSEGAHPLRGALETAAAAADYPFLAANISEDGARWQPEGVQPWTVLERAGLRIGVVGLSTMDTPQTTVPTHVEGLTFGDPVQAVRELLPELQAADLDATVLVAHLTGSCEPKDYLEPGEPCTPDGEIGRLLTELPVGTFDVMVLGHAHTLLAHRVGDTFLLESRAKGHALTQVDLVIGPDGVDADRSRVLDVWGLVHDPADPGCTDTAFDLTPRDVGGRTLAPSPRALALVDELEAASGSLCEEIACADDPLERNRTAASPLGSWMADAMLAAFPTADLAIQNSGGIRAPLPAGSLRREHFQAVMPFDNRTLRVRMTGAQVRAMLRIGSSGAHGILQIAGATYGVDPSLDRGTDLDRDGQLADWERDRLCRDVTVNGAPLRDDATYEVITSDFLHAGGDHLGPAFAGTEVLEQGPLLREIFYAAAEATEGCIQPPQGPQRIRVGTCP
ncbi:MAG: bifunctional metallophosphatase/5'-nucleotidase [Myxococcales bacterium]|nr:bifunctional metallophosphatase/5'-nucleotidase [Myxococcales bacterium]